ncbi:MAG: hypothetical protein K2O75_00780 [Lactobacillus sp.]|uniref:hypothetical protein n=1 Tax=Lactobacillus sp. TaxID=1591 RepID=UPI0023BF0553|nr:hypothetical protein [Lactobacillus sp.]MDE7049414.1 hypothetical protein [Lactobacillus sp.]
MSKKVTSIDFIFENCEVGTLPINAVPSFYFDDLTKNISHRWLFKNESVDEIETTISCKYAHFQIDYELAKKVKTNVMELFDEDIKENNFAKRLLRWNDITSINLHYQNGTSTNIYVPFDEVKLNELDEDNKLQKTKLVKYDSWEVGFNENYKNHNMIMIDIGK